MEDVVDYIYMLPESSQLRAIRVSNFIQSLYLEACGRSGPSPGDTSGRLMQHLFPSLALIRSRGLIEDRASGYEPPAAESCASAAQSVETQLPARGAVLKLTEQWVDAVDGVQRDPRLASLQLPMWRCLTAKSSLSIEKDVPASYLDSVSQAMSASRTRAELRKYSRAYADCAKPYFHQLRSLLLINRPTAVERNRELLETFAAELAAAGYSS